MFCNENERKRNKVKWRGRLWGLVKCFILEFDVMVSVRFDFSTMQLASTSLQPLVVTGRGFPELRFRLIYKDCVHSRGGYPPTRMCTHTHTHMYTHTHACSPTHTLYEVTDIKQREWHMLHTRRADLNCIWTRVSEECHHLIHKAWTVCTELLVLETWPPVGLYFHEKNKINIAVKKQTVAYLSDTKVFFNKL